MCHGFLRVPPLRRVTFSRRRKSNQKGLPYHSAASPRLGGSLTPALSWGHAATGHPWPIAALPASMPVDPLHRTSTRPPGGRADQKHCTRGGRPAGLFGARVLRSFCSRCRGTKAAFGVVRHCDAAVVKPDAAVYQVHPGLRFYDRFALERSLRSSSAATGP